MPGLLASGEGSVAAAELIEASDGYLLAGTVCTTPNRMHVKDLVEILASRPGPRRRYLTSPAAGTVLARRGLARTPPDTCPESRASRP